MEVEEEEGSTTTAPARMNSPNMATAHATELVLPVMVTLCGSLSLPMKFCGEAASSQTENSWEKNTAG